MNRFVKIVDKIASDDIFTIKKPIKFKPEGGVTRFSLENARMIRDGRYQFVRGIMQYDNIAGDWHVTAFFERDGEMASHKFGGFSFGYGGEGPHGLIEFSEMFGIGLSANKITNPKYRSSLPPKGVMDLVQMFG